MEYVEVSTSYGRVRGRRSEGLATFKGMPYAGAVSGANRFKAAPPLKPWTGVRDALRIRPRPRVKPDKTYYGRRTGAGRGLPLPERLDARARRPQASGHVLQPWRRLH